MNIAVTQWLHGDLKPQRGVDLTRLEQAIETLVCLGKWDDDIERDEPFTWTVERQAELIQRAIDADFDNKKPAGQDGPNGNSAHE